MLLDNVDIRIGDVYREIDDTKKQHYMVTEIMTLAGGIHMIRVEYLEDDNMMLYRSYIITNSIHKGHDVLVSRISDGC